MKRRSFIKTTGILAGAGSICFSLGNMPLRAFARPQLPLSQYRGRVLVLVQLSGGNDGLNMVIPFEDAKYYSSRPTIAIPKPQVLQLNTLTGLHPALQPLQGLYEQGKMAIVQNVGYPNPNRSHFRATDIMLTASDSTQVLYDGWAGRYLTHEYPQYPGSIPEHPMAIQLGSVQSLLFQSVYGGMGIAFDDPNTFYQLVSGSGGDNDPPPNTVAGRELKFLKQVAAQSVQYATIIKQKADAGTNLATYPNTKIAGQLKIIADLISGGLQTPVYLASLGGFDTHSNQLTTHTNLYKQLADAIAAFQTDLNQQGLAQKVTLMTFSEFGRRVNQNGSEGTDHGTAAPMLIFGGNINGGIIGANPDLNNLDANGDLQYVFDYRQVYASMLKDHLGMPAPTVTAILQREFQALPIIATPFTGVKNYSPIAYELEQNFPNPFTVTTAVPFTLAHAGNVTITVFNALGKEVATLTNTFYSAGTHTLQWNAAHLPSGTYFYRMQSGGFVMTRKMQLVQ